MANVAHVAKFGRFSLQDCVCTLFLANVRERIEARGVRALGVLVYLGLNVNAFSLAK